MDVYAVQALLPSFDRDFTVKQSAAFHRMVRHVDIFPHRDGVTAHDRVAVVAGGVHRVHTVDAVRALVGEKFELSGWRPGDMATRMRLMLSLHLLKEGDVGLERAQALANLIEHEAPIELREPLVDVVSNNGE